ncbi:hypothetical protein [Cytophaga aurantiaca]|uniref:hypothetical protein n=1 Tax=Cytophaga aurantiaca TaxID=29530 RepID=UPI00037C0C1E|nr:hypothetical protein [Cytophaga aurantiaca]
MGYELHIVRQKDWEDYEEESSITLDEWLAYVETDSELIPNSSLDPSKRMYGDDSPGFVIWKEYPGNTYETSWLDFFEGSISTKHPDDITIAKMIQIAKALNARVQGDEGEFYDEEYIQKALNKKKCWEFWK